MALDPCPHCGKAFDHDNEGARKQHILSCERKAEQFAEAREPVPVDDAEQQPAPAGGGGVGEAVGAMLDVPNADAPVERRVEGVQAGANLLGGLLQISEQRKQRREQAARDATLEEAGEYPQCVGDGCNHRFKEIPEHADEVVCPGCGTVNRIIR